MFAKQGKYAECIEPYRKACVLMPEDSASHYNLGLNLIRLGRYESAVEPLAEAFQLDPASVAHRYQLSRALVLSKRVNAALVHLPEVLRKDPDRSTLYLQLCRHLDRIGRRASALVLLRHLSRVQPARTDVHQQFVAMLSRLRQWHDLLVEVQRWADTHPKEAYAWGQLASWRVSRALPIGFREPRIARLAARKAVQLSDRKDPKWLVTLAEVSILCGDYGGGRKLATEARSKLDLTEDSGLRQRLKTRVDRLLRRR